MAEVKAPKWVCVSKVGAVVPTEAGGSRSLKRGDILEGEYYEQMADKIQGLIRYADLDVDFKAQLEKEQKIKSGESFPSEFQKARKGEAPDFDPRFDPSPVDAAGTLAQVVKETSGEFNRSQHNK